MSEETGRWQHPRPSDHDLLVSIGRDLKRLYENTLQQSLPSDIGALLHKIEQAERERTLREQ